MKMGADLETHHIEHQPSRTIRFHVGNKVPPVIWVMRSIVCVTDTESAMEILEVGIRKSIPCRSVCCQLHARC